MLASGNRGPWHMEIIDAVSRDGWILGRKMLTIHDAGAYGRFSVYGLTKHSFHHTGAYTIPNLHFDGYVVFTNRIPTTAMRGYGVTGLSTAIEIHAERVAHASYRWTPTSSGSRTPTGSTTRRPTASPTRIPAPWKCCSRWLRPPAPS